MRKAASAIKVCHLITENKWLPETISKNYFCLFPCNSIMGQMAYSYPAYFFSPYLKSMLKIWPGCAFQVYLSTLQPRSFKALNSDTGKTDFLVEYLSYIHYFGICISGDWQTELSFRWDTYNGELYLHPFPRISPSITCKHKLLYSCYYFNV